MRELAKGNYLKNRSQTPDGKESDYYHWKPKIKDSCFMG
jgi:hypothetical protein